MSEAVADTQPLFHSPLGLFDFQAEGVARTYWEWTEGTIPSRLALWDTGIGKTVLGLASLALAFEDDLIDIAVVVVEANKVLDWATEDTPKFTDLTVLPYRGDPKRRKNILANPPQVLVTSWQTSRNDIGTMKVRGRSVQEPGILTEFLKGKRVAFIFDEFSALRSRSSKTYIAWEYLLRTLRKTPYPPKCLALTATSVERAPEDHFNACRLIAPTLAPTVEYFYSTYVRAWDYNDNPIDWHNLTAADTVPGVIPLNQVFAPITSRKRKTDPDVIDQFPTRMENPPTYVDLHAPHKRLYDMVEEIFRADGVDELVQKQGFGLLRQLANHPMSLLASQGEYARQVVNGVGRAYIESLAVAKVEAMLEWQARMADQQTVIFTFYGQSVLPLLEHYLRGEGYRVVVNHGAMSAEARQASQHAFKSGDAQIFLSSDAGAKGLNLGCGSGLLHYELPVLPSTYVQRSDRIHRIDSKHPSVTIDSLIARDTLEHPMALKMLKRNEWGEKVMDADYDDAAGDPGERYLRASDRLALFRRAAKR